jgi:hypothetical protein
MLVMAFLQWWYGPGWRDAGQSLAAKMRDTYLSFSVPILLKTLFAPWRRIITPAGGALDQRLRAVVDNTVSRFVGLMVRLMALAAAMVLLLLYAVFGGLLLVLWPAIPLLGPALIVGGLL